MSILDNLKFDADGYLEDPKVWTKEIAEAIAKREGVTLTERSWVVINYARKEFETKGEAPTLRAITKNTLMLIPKNSTASSRVDLASWLQKYPGCINPPVASNPFI